MAEVWKPHPQKVYLDWIKTIEEEASDDLTTWEISFIASIQQRISTNWDLTETQADKLEQVYVKYTS